MSHFDQARTNCRHCSNLMDEKISKLNFTQKEINAFSQPREPQRNPQNQNKIPSLNMKLPRPYSEQTTTENGPVSDRTNFTTLASIALTDPLLKQNPQKSIAEKCHHNPTLNPHLNHSQSSYLQRLSTTVSTLSKFSHQTFSKLLTHLSKTTTADKYIRLLYSILKLYRAFHQKNRFGPLSKQLLTTRRVLQWDTKYQLFQQLRDKNLSAFDFGYKIFQLISNLLDFLSFYTLFLAGPNQQLTNLSEIMYQWQDDCYFYQCLIQLILAGQTLVKNLKSYFSQSSFKQKQYELLYKVEALKQEENLLKNKLNITKWEQNIETQPENQIEKIYKKRIQQKMEQKSNLRKHLLNSYNQWIQAEKAKFAKDILKSSIKTLKYICDVTTSYNNYSWKIFELSPVSGGWLSVASSLLSMALIWGF